MTSEKLKENILNSIQAKLFYITGLNTEQVSIITNLLSNELQFIKLSHDDTLPSVDINNNDVLCRNYLASKKLEGLSDNTIRAYRFGILRMCQDINLNFADINTMHLRYHFAMYGQTVSQVTVENQRRYLNSFFQWLEDENYIQKNPCRKIKKIKCTQKVKKPLTAIEVEKIRDICAKLPSIRNLALVDLLLSTGVRCEEITKITICDCDFNSKAIRIQGKGAKERYVYMTERCKMHLLDYLEERPQKSEYLFCTRTGDQISKNGLFYIMKQIGKLANVDKCRIHRFRAYFATTLVQRGCDILTVKELLGHSKVDTTSKHYVATNQQSIHNEFDKYNA